MTVELVAPSERGDADLRALAYVDSSSAPEGLRMGRRGMLRRGGALLAGTTAALALPAMAGTASAAPAVKVVNITTQTTSPAAGDGMTNDYQSFVQAFTTLGATGGIVYVPAGTYLVNQSIAIPSNVVIKGDSAATTIIKAMAGSGANRAVFTTASYASYANGSIDATQATTRFGIFNVTVDGNTSAMTAKLMKPPTSLGGQYAAGGTFAANSYEFVVVAVNADGGRSEPSPATFFTLPQPGVSSNNSVTLTWPAVSNADHYDVFAAAGGGTYDNDDTFFQQSTTSTTITLSSYNSGAPGPRPGNNASAQRGLALFGFDWVIEDVVVRDCPGTAVYLGFNDRDKTQQNAAEYTGAGNGPEARVNRLQVHGKGHHSLVVYGPHDSIFSDVTVWNFGSSTSAGVDGTRGIWVVDKGSGAHFTTCHVYGGGHSYAWQLDNDAFLNDCTGEGANVAQLLMNYGNHQVTGGQFFRSDSATSGVCIKVNSANVLVQGARLYGYDGTAGYPVDLRSAGGNVRIHAETLLSAGSVLAGNVVQTTHDIDIAAWGGAASVKQVPITTTFVQTVGVGTAAVNTASLTVKPAAAGVTGLSLIAQTSQTAQMLEVKNAGGTTVFSVDGSGKVHTSTANQVTSGATAGTAQALPGAPAGYIVFVDGGGTPRKIPYWS